MSYQMHKKYFLLKSLRATLLIIELREKENKPYFIAPEEIDLLKEAEGL